MQRPAFLHLPKREDILRRRPLGRFTHYLARNAYWHMHRRNVARGAAIGIFIGSLPYFGHVATILVLCLWRKAYIPLAIIMPFLVTGPLTIVPFFYASYQLGFWLLERFSLAPAITIHYADIHRLFLGKITVGAMGDRLWHAYWVTWIGSTIMGAVLSGSAYLAILLGWRLWIRFRLSRRRQARY